MNLSEAFLRFVLDLPTVEWKCHLMPFSVSLCVFIIQPTTPWWRASQQASTISSLQISSSVVEKGQANTLALMLEVLYLSTDPDIWAVQPSVHCPIVCGTACERRLFFKRVCAARTREREHTQPLCVCVYLCVCVCGYISRLWRSLYSMAPSLWQVNMTFGATMKTAILNDLAAHYCCCNFAALMLAHQKLGLEEIIKRPHIQYIWLCDSNNDILGQKD